MRKTLCLSALLTSVTLTACVSVIPKAEAPQGLYRFRSTEAGVAGSPIDLPLSVELREPDGSVLLLGSSIVFEEPNGALLVLKNAQWSDDASSLLQSLLLERLNNTSDEADEIAVSYFSNVRTDVSVQWRVTDLVIRNDEAVAAFEVMVLAGLRSEPVGQFSIIKTAPYTGKPSGEGVEALITAAREAADEVGIKLSDMLVANQGALKAESSSK